MQLYKKMYTEELVFNKNRDAGSWDWNYRRKRCYKEKITSVHPSSRHLGDKSEGDERDLPQLDS